MNDSFGVVTAGQTEQNRSADTGTDLLQESVVGKGVEMDTVKIDRVQKLPFVVDQNRNAMRVCEITNQPGQLPLLPLISSLWPVIPDL